jgi:hypothetical protein
MEKQRVFLALIVVVTLFVLCGTVSAATINSITVSGNQLTIGGVGFNGTITVTLNAQKLTVVSSTPTQIIATMDPIPEPGTYRLVVKAGKPSATSYVAIPSAPAVVETIALFNQTTGVPVITLFTPKVDGLYRLTIYLAETVPGSTGGGWEAEMYWKDVQGSQSFGTGVGCSQINERIVTEPARLLAAQPLTYEVINSNASGTYEILITVERLM